MHAPAPTLAAPLRARRVIALWWPLAASWLLMGAEMPMLTAAMTRMPGGEPHLAAIGALVYPLSILIEAPIIMLLTASTALVTDLATHGRLLRFAHGTSALLTGVHALVAFTPLFDGLVLDLIGAPPETLEPARLGMQLMTPWTWAIGYRRFQQGVLIRCGRSDLVGVGTVIRLTANLLVLLAGLWVATWPGVAVGASAISCGVLAEAAWAGWAFRRAARPLLPTAPPGPALRWGAFARFYAPLAFTPIITIVIQPLGSWAMSKMHAPLQSLAAWPAVYGIVFLSRSAGFAYNEVVVALAGEPGGPAVLRRCGVGIAAATTAALALLSFTPLGALWFDQVSGLPADLVALSRDALPLALAMPGYAVAQNYLQGRMVHAKRTRPITEAVLLYLVVCSLCLLAGMRWMADRPGIEVTLLAFNVAGFAQTWWLWRGLRAMR
ncbi:MAG: hypothetical protein ACON4Z_08625 [Planctomycetota bacterium]